MTDFHQVQEYLKKDFKILENWFYDSYMVLNPRKCEFMGFGKTSENEIFTYHEIRLEKTAAKKLFGITIDQHLMHYRGCLFLAINRKRSCQTLSSVANSIIGLLFGCLVLLGFTEKSTNYMRGLYVYVIMVTPRAITNF